MIFQNRTIVSTLVLAGALVTTTARAEDYKVKKGDCLYRIAISHHVSLASLERANPQIKNPDLIFPGETVHIPRNQPPPKPAHPTKPPSKPHKPPLPVLTPPVSTSPPTPKPPKPPKPPTPPTPPPPTATPTPPTFVFNFGGPEIDLTSPQRGAQLPTGAIAVKGQAKDPDGISLVTVDGVPATLKADGSFVGMATLKEGANVIAIRATSKKNKTTDAQIGVIAGTFGANVPEAVAARVSNEALKTGANAIEPLLAQDVKALAGKPVASYSVSPFTGVKIATDVEIGSLSLAAPNVDVQATNAGLDADVGVKNLDLSLPVTVKATAFGAPISFKHTLSLHFDRFGAKGRLDLAKQANGALVVDASPLKVDYYPTLAADIIGQKTLDDLDKLLGSVSAAIPGHPNLKFDEVSLVNKVIAMVWNQGMKQTVDTRIASMITTPGLTGLPLQLGPQKATVKYALDTVSIDADGFTLSTGLDFALAGPDVHGSKGALLVGGAAPRLNGATGMKLAVAQDMVNRLLEEGWRKGLLDKTFDKNIAQQAGMLLNASSLKLLVPALSKFLPSNADLEVSFKPGAAPIVQLAAGGKATLEVTEAVLQVSVVLGSTKTTLFTNDVHATVPVTFAYKNGALVLNLGKTKFTFDIRKSIVPLPKIAVETALDLVVPFAVDFVAGKFLAPIPLPQPTILGVTPKVRALATSGAKKDFLEVDLGVK